MSARCLALVAWLALVALTPAAAQRAPNVRFDVVPMKGHGWQPTSMADLVREMAEQVARSAPAVEPLGAWHY